MRRDLVAVVRWFCLPMLAMWCLGCGTTQVSLVDTGAVHLESSAPGNIYVAWSDAYERGDGFVVTGVVRRKDTVGPPVKVTVSVEVVSSSGAILDRAQADDVYVPRRKVNRVQGFERFSVRFPDLPPEGSSLRVIARSS